MPLSGRKQHARPREARLASPDCRSLAGVRSRNISRARHAKAMALQIASCRFKSAGSMLTCSQRMRMPNARSSHDVVGLAGASAAYLRNGWEEGGERSAVGAAAMAAKRGAHTVAEERGRVARGSRCAANERSRRSNKPEYG